jgi:hypothetical protein
MYSKASWDKSQVQGSVYKWQFIGIPIRSVIANPTFAGSYVRQYYESGITSATKWIQLQNESVLTSFTGYEIVQEKPTIYTFTGVLENESLTRTMTFTDGATYQGQHLVVNPYTAAIDITKINFGNAMESSVYFYNTGSYNDWKNNAALKYDSVGNNPGQYIVSTLNTAGKAIGIPSQIPSMQAFLVKATNNSTDATLNIPYSSVVQQNTSRQTAPSVKTGVEFANVNSRIDVKGSRFADRMWLFTVPTCSHNFDNGWDGRKFIGSPLTPQLFAMENDDNYQIDAVDDINNSILGFLPGEDSNYTITFTHTNMESLCSRIYLQDLLSNKVVEITKSGSEYSFVSLQTDTVKRFRILLSPYITDSNETNQQFNIFTSNHFIYIQNFSNLEGIVKIYDMTGRCMFNSTFMAKDITVLQSNLPSGAYVIHAITKSGIEQKKVVLI